MELPRTKIYSATYSNVPVYEYNVEGNHVMRRRGDAWINATHILKVAGHDKPARTRILEREVQKGTHEKVQGGYGKYQGTWISLEDGRVLAQRNNCLEKLLPLFEFQPGDRSPPPAPKHMTAQTSRPKAPRNMAPPRRVPGRKRARKDDTASSRSSAVPQQPRMSEVSFDAYSDQMNEDEAADQATVLSDNESAYGANIHWPGATRKRKRGMEQPPQPEHMSFEDQQHLLWSDELLDHFMLLRGSGDPAQAPLIPDGININRAVDDKGNTALHWAAAMGDLHLVQEFIHRGANISALTNLGVTPLVHAVTFTNNFDKQTMGRLTEILYPTAGHRDCFGSTVFHHIATSTVSKSKYQIARYYLHEILSRLQSEYGVHGFSDVIDQQDERGETATLIAARNGARKCARLLTAFGARTDIPNQNGETAEQYITQLNERRRDRQRQLSSSPPPVNGQLDSMKANGFNSSQLRPSQYASEAASTVASQLPTLVASRTEALAAAYEADLTERETEAREGERLLELRRQELSTIRKQAMSLSSQDQDDVVISMEEADLQNILDDSKQCLDEEQQLELRQLLAKYKQARGAQKGDEAITEQTSRSALSKKLKLASQITQQQQRRHQLVEDVLSAQGLASRRDERHDIYKQLIMSALGVKADDVETMLPEILAELEDARAETAERANAAPDVAMGGIDTAPVRMAMPQISAAVQNGNVVYAPVQVAG